MTCYSCFTGLRDTITTARRAEAESLMYDRLQTSQERLKARAAFQANDGRDSLADHILTVAIMLQCCVCRRHRLWRYVLWLNGAS